MTRPPAAGISDAKIGEAFRPSDSLLRALAGEPVRVGTENRAKLAAVREALAPFAADPDALRLVPVGVASGVAEQPIGWSEITRGARNRARAAFASGDAVLAVGIEDGLARLGDPTEDEANDGGDVRAVFNVGCAWISDGERESYGYSSAFGYPTDCLEPAWRDQEPIGDLFDALWRARRDAPDESAEMGPSGRSSGNIGMLTGGRLDRSSYGAQAIVCALVRFLHTDLYD